MLTKEQVGVEVREGEKGQTSYKCYILYPKTIFNNTILIKEKKALLMSQRILLKIR